MLGLCTAKLWPGRIPSLGTVGRYNMLNIDKN